jgi:hypothetical protein
MESIVAHPNTGQPFNFRRRWTAGFVGVCSPKAKVTRSNPVGCAKFRPFRINCERRDCAGAINLREFPAVTAKRKSRLAGLLYSSILTPHSGYRHADNIIAGRSLTGYAIAL